MEIPQERGTATTACRHDLVVAYTRMPADRQRSRVISRNGAVRAAVGVEERRSVVLQERLRRLAPPCWGTRTLGSVLGYKLLGPASPLWGTTPL